MSSNLNDFDSDDLRKAKKEIQDELVRRGEEKPDDYRSFEDYTEDENGNRYPRIQRDKPKPDHNGYCTCVHPETVAGDYTQTCGRCGGNWY